jgi:predicted O-methyltransferase YrrM
MTTILEQFTTSGKIKLPSGKSHTITDCVSTDEGLYLQYLIQQINPKVAVEVGLGSGISSLYILEAMKAHGGKTLIGMDPSQFNTHTDRTTDTHGHVYNGIGLYAIKKSGYGSYYKFYNSTSQQILPQLVGKQTHVNFAFIDGWHTFDHTLIDFFYIDQLLTVGGIVVFHDISFPSINSVCSFVSSNRNYIRLQIPKQYFTKNICAFKKNANDDRNWNHFVPFWETPGLLKTLRSLPSLLRNAVQNRISHI